jgi:UV DNA damage endonuclease
MPIRKIGYACQNLAINENVKKKDYITSDRTLRMSGFSLDRCGQLAAANTRDLVKIMEWNANNGIQMFRVGSGIFPFMDHPELGYKLHYLDEAHQELITAHMNEAGRIAREAGIRLSCHPGPYTCLASPNTAIVQKSIMCLEMHQLIGDLLGHADDFNINIHVGGVYEDKATTAKRFCDTYKILNPNLQRQLTVENDDKSSMWNPVELYDMIYSGCGVRLVYDYHHHRFCHNYETVDRAVELCFSTWPEDQVPKIHYSESAFGKRPQAHSDYIEGPLPVFDTPRLYDVMLETKAKDLALKKYLTESAGVV